MEYGTSYKTDDAMRFAMMERRRHSSKQELPSESLNLHHASKVFARKNRQLRHNKVE